MGGKSKSYVIGYKYFLDVLHILCYGNAGIKIRKIMIGDKIAWEGKQGTGEITIDEPDLFGGESGEGGFSGTLEVMTGEEAQARSSYLASKLSPIVPAFRGVLGILLKNCMVASMNPYPKQMKYQVEDCEETIQGANVYVEEFSMNPAQIIANVLTNPDYGANRSLSELDVESFKTAATTLKDEKFGLCAYWNLQTTANSFIGHILEIIDGVLIMDYNKGKRSIKLIRDDYNPDSLPVFTEDEIVKISDFTRDSITELVNEVTVTFKDWDTGMAQSVTEQSTFALAINPTPRKATFDYPEIPTQELARRVALSKLCSLSAAPAQLNIVATRAAADLNLGDCIKVSYKADGLNIESMIVRVIEIAYGFTSNWEIHLKCIEDVYGMPETTFEEQPSEWTPPVTVPQAVTEYSAFELPYFLVAMYITGDNDSAWGDLPDGYGFLATTAAQPAGLTVGYNILIQEGGIYKSQRSVAFHDWVYLDENIDDVVNSFVVKEGAIDSLELGTPLLLESEIMEILTYNKTNNRVTVTRGCMDTVPTTHNKGVVLWFLGAYDNIVEKEFIAGVNISYKMQPYTAREEMNLTACPTSNFKFNDRATRPIAPANININNQYRPKKLTEASKTLTWARRPYTDTIKIRHQREGDLTPETGTTYTITCKAKNAAGGTYSTLGKQENITNNSLDLVASFPSINDYKFIRLELLALRDGLESWQTNIVEYEHDF